jgi:hypothetical protein
MTSMLFASMLAVPGTSMLCDSMLVVAGACWQWQHAGSSQHASVLMTSMLAQLALTTSLL